MCVCVCVYVCVCVCVCVCIGVYVCVLVFLPNSLLPFICQEWKATEINEVRHCCESEYKSQLCTLNETGRGKGSEGAMGS